VRITTRNCRISIAFLSFAIHGIEQPLLETGGDPAFTTLREGVGRGVPPPGLDGILSGVKDRRIWTSVAFLCLLLPVLVGAQGERPQTPPAPPAAPAGPFRGSVTLEGREVAVPVSINSSGPMFGLSPLVT